MYSTAWDTSCIAHKRVAVTYEFARAESSGSRSEKHRATTFVECHIGNSPRALYTSQRVQCLGRVAYMALNIAQFAMCSATHVHAVQRIARTLVMCSELVRAHS